MYKIEFTEKAEKQFDKLDFVMQKRIINVLERIKVRPFYFVRRIINSSYFRLRVGDYRIILDIKSEKLIIHVIEVKHRKNVYKL